MNKKYFPIFVDISSKPVLVIGAGEIAYRKILNLLDFGAEIVCIAPLCISKIEQLAETGKISYTAREYVTGDADEFDYVFAATNNPSADKQIYEDCKNRGILLNVADVPNLCSFIMPAYVKREPITFAISSGGAAPFYAKYLKDRISEVFTENTGKIAKLASYFRCFMIKDTEYFNEMKRKEMVDWFLEQDWNHYISENNYEDAEKKIDCFFESR